MMELRIGHTRLRAHALTLLALILAAALAGRAYAAAMLLSLAAHEAAHLMCARLLGVRVEELQLMPFGGAARMGNLYLISPARLLAIAAAGPAANLALVILAAALAQWRALGPLQALTLARCSLTLMLFNLLPALPLDGGRMLYAITAGRLGRARAARLGIRLGRGLRLLLCIGAIAGTAASRRLNLSPILAGIFICSSAEGERSALTEARAASLISALRRGTGAVPMCLCAIDDRCTLKDALKNTLPDAATLFIAYHSGRPEGWADDAMVLEAALEDPMRALRDIALIRWGPRPPAIRRAG